MKRWCEKGFGVGGKGGDGIFGVGMGKVGEGGGDEIGGEKGREGNCVGEKGGGRGESGCGWGGLADKFWREFYFGRWFDNVGVWEDCGRVG